MASHEHLEAYNIFFGSLANSNRLAIINSLLQNEKNVSEICKDTGFEQTMVSHNLKRLEKCGMVFVTPDGKNRNYKVNQKTIKPLMKFIDQHIKNYCCKLIEVKK